MFVALQPPDDVREDLESFLEPRRAAAPFRWTLADQLHLTLAFLPEIEDHDLDELTARLAEAASRRQPVDLRVAGGGAFPDVGRGRVLFADLAVDHPGGVELERLATGCRNAAVAAGVRVDGQRFRPHLTLARCGRPTELTRWVRLLDAYEGPPWRADSVVLMASHLGEGPRRRPRYEHVATVPMAGPR